MSLSLIVPIYNEEENIQNLYNRSVDALSKINEPFEIVFVNDGSRDDSLSKLIALHKQDNRCKIINLSRNYGHQAGYTAGMEYCKGDYICLMDGDLQDPPEVIPRMFESIKENDFDVVIGERNERHEGFMKKMMINIFHKIFNKTTKINATTNTGNFSLMKRKALNAMLKFNERNRYLPGIRYFIGFKQGFVSYDRPDRAKGDSMKTTQLFKLALDAIFSFSNWPLKFCLYMGLVGTFIFFCVGMFTIIAKLLGLATPGWSSTLISIYFIGTLQLLFLGVIGEYVYRIYSETQKRPIYLIDEIYE